MTVNLTRKKERRLRHCDPLFREITVSERLDGCERFKAVWSAVSLQEGAALRDHTSLHESTDYPRVRESQEAAGSW